jgi:hypothetical protein
VDGEITSSFLVAIPLHLTPSDECGEAGLPQKITTISVGMDHSTVVIASICEIFVRQLRLKIEDNPTNPKYL